MKMSKYTTEVSILNTYSRYRLIQMHNHKKGWNEDTSSDDECNNAISVARWWILLYRTESVVKYITRIENDGNEQKFSDIQLCESQQQAVYLIHRSNTISECQPVNSLLASSQLNPLRPCIFQAAKQKLTHSYSFIQLILILDFATNFLLSYYQLSTKYCKLHWALSSARTTPNTPICVWTVTVIVCACEFFLSLSQFNVTFVSPFLRLRYDFAVFFLLIYIKYIYACYLLLLFLSCVLQNCLLQSLNTNLVLGERQKKANLSSLGKPLKKHSTQSNSHSERRESTKPRICMTSIKCRK